jgi:putative membrane protein
MISTIAASAPLATAAALHPGWAAGPGFGWWFLLIPVFWILVFGLLFALLGRRWSRSAPPWVTANAPGRSAESTLAERFAQGDIDEAEYRARLEVIRANNPGGR